MATEPTRTARGANESTVRYQWVLGNGETGDAVLMPNYTERSVQVSGDFGAGGNVRIEGSLDGTYVPINDPQGNALDITAAKIETILEAVDYIRPTITAGDGTTALTVTILFKRESQS